MSRLLRLSLRTRLVLMATGSATIALCLVTCLVAARDLQTMRRARISHVLAQADILSINIGPTLAQRDRTSSVRLLRTLEQLTPLDRVTLWGADDKAVATLGPEVPYSRGARGWRMLENGELLVQMPVTLRGQNVGGIALQATFHDVHEQFASRLRTSGLVLAGAVAVSALAAYLLMRGVTRSLLEVARAAEKVRIEQNCELHVESTRTDEIGVLCRAFNDMLGRLKASKKALDAAHDDLEKRVAERTLQLVEEIRHRRQVEQDLIRARDEAQSANRAKSEFLANMSHEIRTPLNAIMGFTDLLNQTPDMDAEERTKSLDIIHDSGKHLLRLIDDMLEMSVLASGQSTANLAPFSPKGLLEEVSAFYREAAEKKGLGFDLVWTTPAPESAESDPVKLRQLLENLIGNAVKFTEQGHVKIFAGVDDVTRSLTIDVSDTGIGIPDDKRQSIFETFSQVDTSVTRKYGGTGIGLALCRHIVRILGGQLSVRSTEGKGSTFSVILPLGQPGNAGRTLHTAASDAASGGRRSVPSSGRTPPLETAASLANRPYPANGIIRAVVPSGVNESGE